MTRKRQDINFLAGLGLPATEIVKVFLVALMVTALLRAFLDWPEVVFLMLLFSVIAAFRNSRRNRYEFNAGEILVSLIATSALLSIVEFSISSI